MKESLDRIENKLDKIVESQVDLKIDVTEIKKDVEKNTEDLEQHIEGVEQNRHRIVKLEEPAKIIKSIAKFTMWLAGFTGAAGVLYTYLK